MTSLRQRMTEDMQVRNLALNTQTSYLQQVSLFARHFEKSPELLGPRAKICATTGSLPDQREEAGTRLRPHRGCGTAVPL